MAGSMVYRNYTTDSGVGASLYRDESNAEATSGGTTLLQAFVPGNGGLSGFIKPRYVNTVLSTDPNRRKKFTVGTVALFNSIVSGAQILEGTGATGLTWNVSSKVGERAKIPSALDTGLTDGDQP
jgi:hypothetical protein